MALCTSGDLHRSHGEHKRASKYQTLMSQKADQVRDHWSFGDNNQVKATVNGQVYLDLTDLVD